MATQAPILVTGAAGFIGARTVEALRAAGLPVVSVDEEPFFRERPEHRGLDFGTIVDRDALFEWLEAGHPLSAIVHLGACSDTMQTDEALLRRLNVEYSQMLWRHAERAALPLIYASSAATYGAGEAGYADDEARMAALEPLNAYGRSKLEFDLWALGEDARGAKPPAWAGFKFFNVYGFGERHKTRQASVVLHAFDQVTASGELKLFKSYRAGVADGEQRRDFIYVDDVVRALKFALERRLPRGIFNLGTGQARSFLDLGHAVFAALGRPERVRFIDMPEGLRERYQYFTEAKMDRLRGAGYNSAFTSLEEGVGLTIERLLAVMDRDDEKVQFPVSAD